MQLNKKNLLIGYLEHIPTVAEIEGNIIQLSKNIILPFQDINALIHFIYPNLSASSDSQYLVKRAILAPKNKHVNAINAAIMTQFPGEAVEYLSADTIKNQTESNHQYLIEFLNSLIIG
ncbi:15102_t:CDS:1, partial [Cetraspora pellucida]